MLDFIGHSCQVARGTLAGSRFGESLIPEGDPLADRGAGDLDRVPARVPGVHQGAAEPELAPDLASAYLHAVANLGGQNGRPGTAFAPRVPLPDQASLRDDGPQPAELEAQCTPELHAAQAYRALYVARGETQVLPHGAVLVL